ncbi:peptidase family M1-domain-containing protein [Obelidium mucronatum]|nr:peptidase family M1-domain-containing protein [Obelidium mucronatum]
MCRLHRSTESQTVGAAATNASAARDILPAATVPSNYKVWLEPNFDTFTFDGTVAIDVAVVEATDQITLNSKNLTIHKTNITFNGKTLEATSTTFNIEKETVLFEFAEQIPAGVSAVLYAEFTGIHNDQMAGFYKSTYTDTDGNKRYLLCTQFEATDARQCIPCYDEPALKATFEATLVVDVELTALSNMNETSCVEFENSAGKKVKEVTFARTPLMSTYLLAFVVGDFESIETVARPTLPADAKPITVRLFTVKGLVSQGTFALEVAARTLEYFSEYFNEAYPLPKSDLVAIPDFGAGAMENWGLVTYRNVCLLCVADDSTASAKQEIAYTVAHELAHQWFGNLVTMTWWNDLWLNEGFATFVGWLAVDHLFPAWNIWTNFIISEFSHALQLDGLRSSHPIDVDVKSAAEVGEIFDAISYSKGASVIRMLNDFLGGQKFMDGVRTYLQEFKYKNTVTADLWRHLSASSGEDIATLMHSWTREMGYPLVSVESEVYDDESKTLTVTLSQSRFLSGGELKPEEDTVNWWVPITVVSHLTGKTGATKHVLAEKQGTISFPYDASTNGYWKLNFGASGLYRVKYLETQVVSIGHILESNLNTFAVGDRIMFLNDAFSLTSAGLGSISTVLNMIRSLKSESDYNVLVQIASTLGTLRSNSYLEPVSVINGLKALGRTVFSHKVEELGYEFQAGEDHFTGQKRALAIGVSERSGDEAVKNELRVRFDRFVAGETTALHPEIRGVAFRSVLSNVTPETAEATFSAVLAFYLDPSTQAEAKDEVLRVLGAVNSAEHMDRLLNVLNFDQEVVKSQDFHGPAIGIVQFNPNPAISRPLVAQWFKNNWEDKIFPLFASGFGMLGNIFAVSWNSGIGEDVVEDIRAWARGDGLDEAGAAARVKSVEGIKRKIDQVCEGILTKTKLMEREREALAAWVATEAL